MIANKDKYASLHVDKENISYTTPGEENLDEQQCVLFRYRILIDSEFVKKYYKMKLATKRLNRILVSREINSLCSLPVSIYLKNCFKFRGCFKNLIINQRLSVKVLLEVGGCMFRLKKRKLRGLIVSLLKYLKAV